MSPLPKVELAAAELVGLFNAAAAACNFALRLIFTSLEAVLLGALWLAERAHAHFERRPDAAAQPQAD